MQTPGSDDRPLQKAGRISLVGAGPGHPRLLTLAAADALANSDAVLHTDVDPRVLDYANPSAEVCAARELLVEGDAVHWSAHAAPRWLLDRAAAGGHAVFLADGDPMLFSHGGELLDRLRDTGVPVTVVPGVTAASAAAAEAAIPITHAAYSSAVALVTARVGGEGNAGDGGLPDFSEIAQFPGTVAVYVGERDPGKWVEPLIAAGKPTATPVVIVAACSRAEQRVVRTTLGELPRVIAHELGRSPAIVLIGPVARLGTESPASGTRAAGADGLLGPPRPLHGRRVLVTRPRGQADELVDRLAELGADVWTQPVIEIADPPDWSAVDSVLARIVHFDWLVFSSVNGVERLLGRLLDRGGDVRRLAKVRLAAIGPSTAASLERFGLRADLMPEPFRAEALAEALVERLEGGKDEASTRPRPQALSRSERGASRVLLARASRGREVLAERLRAAGVEVEQVVVYTSRDVVEPRPHVREAIRQGRVDWTLVTSSAIARSLDAMFGEQLSKTHLASISPITSDTLRQLGHQPAAEATEYTMEGIVRAVLNWKE